MAEDELWQKPMVEELEAFNHGHGNRNDTIEGIVVVETQRHEINLWKHFNVFLFRENLIRDDLETYYAEMKKLAIQILELMANALTIDTMEIKEIFAAGNQLSRFNYYPPCPQPDLVMGLNPHSDAGGLTILLQANEMDGLQIKKDGLWIPVKPLPNAFIINIGDILEIITNGIYRSSEHRATVNSEKERLSIAAFYSPALESTLGPAPSLVTPTTPALFRSITYAEYLSGFLARELRGKSYLDSMRIQNGNEKSSQEN